MTCAFSGRESVTSSHETSTPEAAELFAAEIDIISGQGVISLELKLMRFSGKIICIKYASAGVQVGSEVG